MKVKLYCVLDSCSGVYDGPVPAHNDQVALRNFISFANNPEHPIGRNPSDFSIWRVGEWNDGIGEVTAETKVCIGHAVDFLTPSEEN